MKISWIFAGSEKDINDRDAYYLKRYDGFGVPPLHRLSDRGPLQHGDTDRGYRLDPRMVILFIGVKGSTVDDFHLNKRELERVFMPRNAHGILKAVSAGETRYLDCHVVAWQEGQRSGTYQEFGVGLKGNNPLWYDPVLRVMNFNVGGGGDRMEVPTVIPMTVGTSVLDMSTSITYSGTARTFPVILIEGPITNPIVTHVEKGWKLDFTGIVLGAGESIEVDTRYEAKTIVDELGNVQMSWLSDDSDLAEFAILNAPDVPAGVNTIHVEGTGVDAGTNISVSYYRKYIAV